MKHSAYFKIFVIVLCLCFLPDLILSLGGRDTYIIFRHPLLLTFCQISLATGCILFFIELVSLALKKKHLKTLCFCILAILFWFMCRFTIAIFVNKSISEARGEVEKFFSQNGKSGSLTVSVEDNVKLIYENYSSEKFKHKDLQLMWSSPRFGKYEFKIASRKNRPFLVRVSTSQNKPSDIWIHEVEK